MSRRLTRLERSFIKLMERNFVKAMRDFEAKIGKEQMSGRKRPDYGLNRINKKLSNGWSVTQKGSMRQGDFIVYLNNSTEYGKYHQLGGKKIPKRLYILEDFATSGKELLFDSIKKTLNQAG